MAAFRKIVVKNRDFLWTYSFDDYDYQLDSNVVIKDCERQGKLILTFRPSVDGHGYCPFNKGLPALKGTEKVIINLNRPKYISEMLNHILDCRLQDDGFSTTGYYDGIKVLTELGYVFDYQFTALS